MFFDEEKSIAATQENVERELGRSLTDGEKSSIAEKVGQNVFTTELSFHFVWLVILAAGSVWLLEKFTGGISSIYIQYVEPYAIWMVSPHTDSVLNFALQSYMWILLVPLALALVAILIPTALATYIVLWVFGFCAGRASDNWLWGIPAFLMLPCIVVVPIKAFFKTVFPAGRIVVPIYFRFYKFVKDKVLRLTKLSMGWWMLVTHVAIPCCLVILVMLFAADKVRLTRRVVETAEPSVEMAR